MQPLVSIIMGSTSDLPILKKPLISSTRWKFRSK